MDLEASPEEKLQLEYATQHFNFTPDSYAETIRDTVVDSISDCLHDTKEQLKNTFRKKLSKQELKKSLSEIENKYITSTDKVLDNFSRYLTRNILIVPKNIVLPEDSVHVNNACKISDSVTNAKCSDMVEQNKHTRKLQVTSNDCEIASAEFYNGDNLIESIKSFDRQCKNTKNSKYKEAVLCEKLGNLETVAARQRKLLKKAEKAQELLRVYDVIEQQEGLLNKKMSVLREPQENQGDWQSVLDKDDEKNVTSKTDEKASNENVKGLSFSKAVVKTSAEKRKLEIALYEEALVATKCRKFADDDSYSFINTERSKENELEIRANKTDN